MNYYQRHIGDYGKKTRHLSLMEHGVYCVLLDHYYATEKPLPAEHDRLHRICGAISATEQSAVVSIADEFFPVGSDGLRHNARADEEIPTAQAAIEASRRNGGKGGRPKQETREKPSGIPSNNPTETRQATQTEPVRGHTPTTNQEPKPQIQAAPQVSDTVASAGALGAAALATLKAKPPTLDEARITSHDSTAAGILSAICTANGVSPATPFHPLIVEWSREFTVDQLKHAIGIARERKPHPQKIPPAYLDPILRNPSRPAATVQAEKATDAAAKASERTAAMLAEQREAASRSAPMPEHLRPKAAAA